MASNTLAIVGLGYVGLPLALLAAAKGHQTIGIDIDQNKLGSLRLKKSYIDDVADSDLENAKNISFTSDISMISSCSTIVICVPTPVSKDKTPDLTILTSTLTALLPEIVENTLIIIESTINPGVCDEVLIPILTAETPFKIGENIFIAHCPERINPGDQKWNVSNIPRVLGANDPISLEHAYAFYTSVIDAPIRRMDTIKEAEAVKIIENSFRDINIAFVNELARSFHLLGINLVNVIDGAATKPFAFMPHYPSIGVGGHCIPVDPYYLIEYASKNGFEHKFLKLARNINEGMPHYTADLLSEITKSKKVAVLGLSYKPNIADIRESPSLNLISILRERGYTVGTYDPLLPEISSHSTIETALDGSDAVVLACPHDALVKILDVHLLKKYKIAAFVDGHSKLKNLATSMNDVDIIYRGVGIET